LQQIKSSTPQYVIQRLAVRVEDVLLDILAVDINFAPSTAPFRKPFTLIWPSTYLAVGFWYQYFQKGILSSACRFASFRLVAPFLALRLK
jgi:hypothetical protein